MGDIIGGIHRCGNIEESVGAMGTLGWRIYVT